MAVAENGDAGAKDTLGGPSRSSNEKVMARLAKEFPDGPLPSPYKDRIVKLIHGIAATLPRHQQIHARLQLEILDVKDEVSRLKVELRRDQDPGKMSRIQSQIGVGKPFALLCPFSSMLTSAQQLMLQINVIREKAAEAEAIVKAITSDIQRLDIAKRNLTSAIQTMERWEMISMCSLPWLDHDCS